MFLVGTGHYASLPNSTPAVMPLAVSRFISRYSHRTFSRFLAFATRLIVMIFGSSPRVRNPTTIYSLPREILAHIFLLSAQSSGSSFSLSPEVIISITHVCSNWRQLALTSGELWTYLTINFPVTLGELDRAQEWIRRSNPYPLCIVVDVRDPEWDFNEDSHPVQWLQMQALMGLILPAANRWQEVQVLADNWQPLHAFLHYTQNISLPLLRGLRLIRCNPYFAAPNQVFLPSDSRVFLPLFGGLEMEKLTSIALEGVHIDWKSAALRGLTRLTLGYHPKDVAPTMIEFRDLLNSCPELDTFILAGWGPKSIVGDTLAEEYRASIQLPRLRSLELGVMIPSYAVSLLALLVIPSLESLTIDDITRYDPQTLTSPDFGPIFNFLSDQSSSSSHFSSSVSMKSLSSLFIMNLDPGETTFHQFLIGLQNLRTLQIRNCPATALSALIPTNIGVPCKPLGRLLIEACDPEVLIQVITARKVSNVPDISQITFQQHADNNLHQALSETIEARFDQLKIKSLPPNPTGHLQWGNYEVDDSDELVNAILEERWDVAGAVMQ